jgi:mannose-1-phosphate guanylyltransferase
MLYAVIIAGGKGERFWPRSVRARPKQFQRIVTARTMLQETFYRVYPEIPGERIFIGAGEQHRNIILEQLEEVDGGNLIVEPVGRNTAPAIGLASCVISSRDSEAVIAVLSADHVVKPRGAFLSALSDAEKAAEQGYIVTFGIEPDRPATEFGYIEVAEPLKGDFGHEIFTVKRFREKPSLELAEEYRMAGTFLWNSGMFIFRADVLLGAMEKYMSALYRGLMRIRTSLGTAEEQRVIEEEFSGFESISIDYGVMERFDRIACLKPRFFWDDVGSWGALERHLKGDERGIIRSGNVVTVDSESSIVLGDEESIIALVGMQDTIVVKEGGRILVCHKNADQKIKDVLRKIAERGENLSYL